MHAIYFISKIKYVCMYVCIYTYIQYCSYPWSIGGQNKIRPLWRHYFTGCAGLLYVIDSADKNRFEESREELSWIVEDQAMKGKRDTIFGFGCFANQHETSIGCQINYTYY